MAEMNALWIVPISIVPGLGLLVLSTSARYMTVALQLRQQKNEEMSDLWLSTLIFKRACCLQQALPGLYGSIALLVIASLLIATTGESDRMALLSKLVMMSGGITALYSVLQLTYEVFTSRRIVMRDHDNLKITHDAVAQRGVDDESF